MSQRSLRGKPVPIYIRLTEINQYIICHLCGGYLVDATTITECFHTFCKSCLVNYLIENYLCPTCDCLIHPSNPYLSIKLDRTMQEIVNKLLPYIHEDEAARERRFWKERNMEQPTKGHVEDNIDAESGNAKQSGKFPCGVCGWGVGNNSIKCIACIKWVHRRCSGITSSLTAKRSTFVCSKCLGGVPESANEVPDSPPLSPSPTPTPPPPPLPPPKVVSPRINQSHIGIILEYAGASAGCPEIKPLERKFILVPARITIGQIQKFISMKLCLQSPIEVDVICDEDILEPDITLKEIWTECTEDQMEDGLLCLYYSLTNECGR